MPKKAHPTKKWLINLPRSQSAVVAALDLHVRYLAEIKKEKRGMKKKIYIGRGKDPRAVLPAGIFYSLLHTHKHGTSGIKCLKFAYCLKKQNFA